MSDQLRFFPLDLNFARVADPLDSVVMSAAEDWRDIDPAAYFQWQLDHGANVVSIQGWAVGGFAYYPTRLGPRAAGSAGTLLPRVLDMALGAGLPTQSYVTVGANPTYTASRPHWLVPGSEGVEILGDTFQYGFLAPESPYTDILCDRIFELLDAYPVDWMLFDWFCYGSLRHDLPLVATPYTRPLYRELFDRPMPEDRSAISPADELTYKREALARQFRRIRDTVRQASPTTRIVFNVPYFDAAEPIWVDHPMLAESDGLFAESTVPAIVDWLLSVKRPEQRLLTTIYGRPDDVVDGERIVWSDVASWRHWTERGCDLVAWAWPVPPRGTVHPVEQPAIDAVTAAFTELAAR